LVENRNRRPSSEHSKPRDFSFDLGVDHISITLHPQLSFLHRYPTFNGLDIPAAPMEDLSARWYLR
jgi:hypothetical protein